MERVNFEQTEKVMPMKVYYSGHCRPGLPYSFFAYVVRTALSLLTVFEPSTAAAQMCLRLDLANKGFC